MMTFVQTVRYSTAPYVLNENSPTSFASLGDLLWCSGCLSVLSHQDPSCVVVEVDSYYCPSSLENLHSSEASLLLERSPTAFACPDCKSALQIRLGGESGEAYRYFECPHCLWDSSVDLKPPMLVKVGEGDDGSGGGGSKSKGATVSCSRGD